MKWNKTGDGKCTRLEPSKENLRKRRASQTADKRSDGLNSQEGKCMYIMFIITSSRGNGTWTRGGSFQQIRGNFRWAVKDE